VAKLSSSNTMSAAYRATSVPSAPIATPMFACLQPWRIVHTVAGHSHDFRLLWLGVHLVPLIMAVQTRSPRTAW
jgi:hypothetical protein